jgi:hypothetical protein
MNADRQQVVRVYRCARCGRIACDMVQVSRPDGRAWWCLTCACTYPSTSDGRAPQGRAMRQLIQLSSPEPGGPPEAGVLDQALLGSWPGHETNTENRRRDHQEACASWPGPRRGALRCGSIAGMGRSG